MDLSNILEKVKTAAPLLAAFLQNQPAGMILSSLVHILNSKKDGSSIEESMKNGVEFQLSQDSYAADKLKKFEIQHEADLKKIDSENFKTEVDDRKNAREFVKKNEGFLKSIAYIMLIGLLGFSIILVIYPGLSSLNDFQKSSLSLIIGMIIMQFKSIISLFTGRNRND